MEIAFHSFEPLSLRVQLLGNKKVVWDIVRKKWVKLTSEEWVRQQWIHFLIIQGASVGKMAVEYQLKPLGYKNLRFDLALFQDANQCILLAEFKKLEFEIKEETLMQLLSYAKLLKPSYYLLSNYYQNYVWSTANRSWQYFENERLDLKI